MKKGDLVLLVNSTNLKLLDYQKKAGSLQADIEVGKSIIIKFFNKGGNGQTLKTSVVTQIKPAINGVREIITKNSIYQFEF